MISFKDAIKKIQENYPGFEEKELTNIDEWYGKEENQEYYKTRFPKSYEAIMKNISTTRKFINIYDGQGGEFAVGCYGSMRSWAFKVLDWMDSDGFYDDEAEAGDIEMVNGFVMMDRFREETLIGLINEIWTLEIVEYSEKVDSAQQKATQFSTVEDVLRQMGALRPLKKNGDLSEKGWIAFETLRNLLIYLAQQNVVKFYEDKLDEFIDKD